MERTKAIIYLTYDGLTDPLGQSQVIPYLIGLRKKGHRITIISFEKKSNELFISEIESILNANDINWIRKRYTKFPIILSTIYDVIRTYVIARRLLKKEKYDIVHCRSYITSLVGLRLQRKCGLKFIFDMRGFFADERIDGGMWNQKKFIYRLIYRFFKNFEFRFLSKADYTVCITHEAEREIHSWKLIPEQPIPIEVIPCCSDFNLFDRTTISEEQKAQLRNELKLNKDDLIISYVGAVGTWYMLDEMLDFFSRVKIKYPTARFLFITHEDPNMIFKKATEKKINLTDNSIIIKKASRNQVPVLLSLSDLSIFFIKPLYSKMASSPAKQGEIMSMGIPIICNSNIGDTSRIIKEAGAGIISRTFTNDEYDFIVEEIERLKSIPPENIRNAARRIFSLDRGVELYDSIYKNVN